MQSLLDALAALALLRMTSRGDGAEAFYVAAALELCLSWLTIYSKYGSSKAGERFFGFC